MSESFHDSLISQLPRLYKPRNQSQIGNYSEISKYIYESESAKKLKRILTSDTTLQKKTKEYDTLSKDFEKQFTSLKHTIHINFAKNNTQEIKMENNSDSDSKSVEYSNEFVDELLITLKKCKQFRTITKENESKIKELTNLLTKDIDNKNNADALSKKINSVVDIIKKISVNKLEADSCNNLIADQDRHIKNQLDEHNRIIRDIQKNTKLTTTISEITKPLDIKSKQKQVQDRFKADTIYVVSKIKKTEQYDILRTLLDNKADWNTLKKQAAENQLEENFYYFENASKLVDLINTNANKKEINNQWNTLTNNPYQNKDVTGVRVFNFPNPNVIMHQELEGLNEKITGGLKPDDIAETINVLNKSLIQISKTIFDNIGSTPLLRDINFNAEQIRLKNIESQQTSPNQSTELFIVADNPIPTPTETISTTQSTSTATHLSDTSIQIKSPLVSEPTNKKEKENILPKAKDEQLKKYKAAKLDLLKEINAERKRVLEMKDLNNSSAYSDLSKLHSKVRNMRGVEVKHIDTIEKYKIEFNAICEKYGKMEVKQTDIPVNLVTSSKQPDSRPNSNLAINSVLMSSQKESKAIRTPTERLKPKTIAAPLSDQIMRKINYVENYAGKPLGSADQSNPPIKQNKLLQILKGHLEMLHESATSAEENQDKELLINVAEKLERIDALLKFDQNIPSQRIQNVLNNVARAIVTNQHPKNTEALKDIAIKLNKLLVFSVRADIDNNKDRKDLVQAQFKEVLNDISKFNPKPQEQNTSKNRFRI